MNKLEEHVLREVKKDLLGAKSEIAKALSLLKEHALPQLNTPLNLAAKKIQQAREVIQIVIDGDTED